jgi:hypothetical protein
MSSQHLLLDCSISRFQHLSRIGLSAGPGGHAATDEALQAAIESLEASTILIQKHQTVLENQRAALANLAQSGSSTQDDNSRSSQRPASGSSQLRYASEEMLDSLKEDFSTSQSAVYGALKSISGYASDRLASDDQVLEAISALQLAPESTQGQPESETIEKWCRALVNFRTAEVKARVDVIYKSKLLEALEDEPPPLTKGEEAKGTAPLKVELESLREEIASVSQMVADHQLRKPTLRASERSAQASLQLRESSFEYVC